MRRLSVCLSVVRSFGSAKKKRVGYNDMPHAPIVFTAAQLGASTAAGDARSQASFSSDTDAWHAYQDEWFATVMMGEKLPALGDAKRLKRWKAARRQRGKIEEQRPHIDHRQALAASGELASARSEAKYEQKCKQRRDGGEEMRIAENLARNLARQKQRHAELDEEVARRLASLPPGPTPVHTWTGAVLVERSDEEVARLLASLPPGPTPPVRVTTSATMADICGRLNGPR